MFKKNKKIPNCSNCEWLNKNVTKVKHSLCGCQGYSMTQDVYGSKVCKNLYRFRLIRS
jgi:hypothetical protein